MITKEQAIEVLRQTVEQAVAAGLYKDLNNVRLALLALDTLSQEVKNASISTS